MKVEDCRRNHITVRRLYNSFVEDRSLTTIFRPGVRLYPNEKSYRDGQLALVKILQVPGNDVYGIEPVHFDNDFPVRVERSVATRLIDVEPSLFSSAGPDINSLDTLRFNLANIYNLSYKEVFSDDFEVTYTTFKYLDEEEV